MTNEQAVELLLEKRRELQSFIDITPKPEETYPHMVAFCEALDVAADALRTQQPKRGRWIKDSSGVIICSECGEEHEWLDYRASFCEDCGAMMDREVPTDGDPKD